MTESPASKRSKIPLHLVIYLSLIPPVYKVETKHIASQGSFRLYLLQKKIEIEMEVVAPFLKGANDQASGEVTRNLTV